MFKLYGSYRVFSPRLVPRQLGDETAVWYKCGDQVPVNLQTARKCTGITWIYMLHINPDTPLAANGEVNNFKVQQKSFNCIFLTAAQMCNKQFTVSTNIITRHSSINASGIKYRCLFQEWEKCHCVAIRQRWFHTFSPCAEHSGIYEGMWARFGSQGSIALNWHSRYSGTRYSGTWLYVIIIQ